jgi:hypothetical protein
MRGQYNKIPGRPVEAPPDEEVKVEEPKNE